MLLDEIYIWCLGLIFGVSPIIFLLLFFIPAPYGRHTREGWGPQIKTSWAWFWMEFPAVFVFLGIFFLGENSLSLIPALFCGLWILHYGHRVFLYPLEIKSSNRKQTPLVIVFMGFTFNCLNAFVNAWFISNLGEYDLEWLSDPRFLIGVGLFFAGLIINKHADWVLKRLRESDVPGYKIPYGGLYHWISCPNYFGEWIQWVGWAVATWSLAGMSFALFTAANLFPRGVTHHRWYQQTFADYPNKRKAVIPFLL